eukprot:GGOE01021598.1.p1 GENE.GGOE01021598.1~~GGOE01021598.1.p1  ORF type:complete len:227 (-),score=69.31 GGOE01021598.1:422-1102(-)
MPVDDPYIVLGLPRHCSDAEIRKAYKKQVLIWHPDKNPNGAERFKQVMEAYTVLTDPTRRVDLLSRTQQAEAEAEAPPRPTVAEWLRREKAERQADQRSAEEIIRQDRSMRAKVGKNLKDLLREQEVLHRAGEQQRHMFTDHADAQAKRVANVQDKLRRLNVPGLEWKPDYECFTVEEERERRQLVAQLIADGTGEVDDIVLYRYYVSASELVMKRRAWGNSTECE